MERKVNKSVIAAIAYGFLSSATTLASSDWEPTEGDSSFVDNATILDSVLQLIRSYEGVPYRYGGQSPKGFDCSGLIYYVMGQNDIKIPRSSHYLSKAGLSVGLTDVKAGDFMFFMGRNGRSGRVGHVSLAVRVDEEGIWMTHATRRGVVTELFDTSAYYRPRFLQARRVIDFDQQQLILDFFADENFRLPRM